MSEWKWVGQFESVLEAEVARTLLESYEIQAFVEGAHLASIFPYATHALGGVRLRVFARDEVQALEILGASGTQAVENDSPITEEAPSQTPVNVLMKRATYGALIGTFLLPGISNFYSVVLYWKAYRAEPECLRRFAWRFGVGMAFNFMVLVVIPLIYLTRA